MIHDIVQSAQTANTPTQQVQVSFEQDCAFATTSTASATSFLEQLATASRLALTCSYAAANDLSASSSA